MKTAEIEKTIADKVAMALRALPALCDFKVYANWGAENARNPYAEGGCKDPRTVDVKVRQRRYEAYTTAVATVEIALDGRIDLNSRVTHVKPEDVYLEIIGLLEEWQRSVSAVKRDLGSEGFGPVGMRLDGGGEWEADAETKELNFTIPFTVKGRVGSC